MPCVSGTLIAGRNETKLRNTAMRWKECYKQVQEMSPRAARLALRMLWKDALVPSNWAFSLDLALTTRAKGALPFTSCDLEVIAANQRPSLVEAPVELDREQRQAWLFAASIRALAIEDSGKDHPRPTQVLKGAISGPRTPTPEEAWLLAFSDELRQLAGGRLSSEDVTKCAINRLRTDGHRSPVVVAREQFIRGALR